jgi:hypothetical protein
MPCGSCVPDPIPSALTISFPTRMVVQRRLGAKRVQCPQGTGDNSPPFQRREKSKETKSPRQGTAERLSNSRQARVAKALQAILEGAWS